jgi:hypothetical protein
VNDLDWAVSPDGSTIHRLLDTEPGRHEALVAADELGIAGIR